MSDLGRRLRRELDEIAAPVDLESLMAHAPVLPLWRVGRALGYLGIAATVIGVTFLVLNSDRGPGPGSFTTVTDVETTTTAVSSSTTEVDSGPRVDIDSSPLSGQWFGTHPDTGGRIVVVNDMIWDGDAFYVMTRLGFGDHVIWRSTDGIEWAQYRNVAEAGELGITGVRSGPTELGSIDGRLIAAGDANGRATAWIDDGSSPWRGVDVAPGGVTDLVYHDGRLVALVVAPLEAEAPGMVGRQPSLWSSVDGEVWTEVAGDDLLGGTGWTSELVTGPSGLLLVGFAKDASGNGSRVTGVFLSRDGVTWEQRQPSGLNLSLSQANSITGGEFGYAATGIDSQVFVSADGIVWAPIGDGPTSTRTSGISSVDHLAILDGRLVAAGGETFQPEGAAFNTGQPRVWSYAADGDWIDVGVLPWRDSPGIAYRIVVGEETMVIWGEIDGSGDWALLTFVPNGGG